MCVFACVCLSVCTSLLVCKGRGGGVFCCSFRVNRMGVDYSVSREVCVCVCQGVCVSACVCKCVSAVFKHHLVLECGTSPVK